MPTAPQYQPGQETGSQVNSSSITHRIDPLNTNKRARLTLIPRALLTPRIQNPHSLSYLAHRIEYCTHRNRERLEREWLLNKINSVLNNGII